GQGPRQIPMTHEHRAFVLEGRVAEYVVGMHMRVDDIADGLGRMGADRSKQPASLAHAAAGINDRDSVVADDETEIGNGTLVVMGHKLERADMSKHSTRQLRYGERFKESLRVGSADVQLVGREHEVGSEPGRNNCKRRRYERVSHSSTK